MKRSKTFGELLCEAQQLLKDEIIEDYRPCAELYGVPNMEGAILVFLQGGSKMIYIPKELYTGGEN